jgi:hypothetical protein
MHRNFAVIVQGEQCAVAELQRLVNQRLRGLAGATRPLFQHARNDFHIMLAKPVQPQPFRRLVHLAVCPHLRVTVRRRPFRHIRMKTLAIPHHWRKQQQVPAPFHLRRKPRGQPVPRLALHRLLAIRAVLRP